MTTPSPLYSEEVFELIKKIVRSFSTKMQLRMKDKKAKIQSHSKQILNLAFTVSAEPLSQAILGGYFLQINLKNSKVLKMACEGYCLDERNCHSLSPLFYTLSHLYSLELCNFPITFYITSAKTLDLLENLSFQIDPIAQAVALLLKYLPNVRITPCLKGLFFEKMQSKLRQLTFKETNEVVSLDFKILSNNLLNP